MSLQIVKSFSRPWPLISAALLMHIGGALAADSAGDVQQQMRDVLAGGIATRPAPTSARGHDTAVRPTGDVQELARRLLQGVPGSPVKSTEVGGGEAAPGAPALQKDRAVHEDAQVMARRLLMGQRNTASARS
jgi:hypothetical protein